MVLRRPILTLALVAGVATAVPAGTAFAGGDAPPQNPSVVGVPITRTANALDQAANAIDKGKGATAARPLGAARRYMIRSYRGARFLIRNTAAAPPEEARASSKKFVKLARRHIRRAHASRKFGLGWIRAQASGDGSLVFADTPTAVFNVFTSQYDAATASVGMVPDTKGNLQDKVKKALNTAIVLRNRLVKVVAAASPPAPEEARAAQEAEEAITYDAVMPGVATLLNDEIQLMQATLEDTPASRSVLSRALSADNQVLNRVNTLWPPATED